MWSAVRPAAARAVRANGALSAARMTCIASRVTLNRTAPSCYRWNDTVRSFAAATRAGRPKKKPVAKKTTRKSAAGTKKRATKKAKPAKRTRKVLTPEEKRKIEIRELKKTALLKEPGRLPDKAWLVYVSSNVKGSKVGADGLASTMSHLSETFKTISTSEMQRLQDTAEKNKLANNASYKVWVESHPAEVIADANRARNRLKKISTTKKSIIQDARQPKRPSTSFTLFYKSRWASGDFTGAPASEAVKTVASEWKALSASQRQPYADLAKSDLERYEKEMHSVLGRTVRKSARP